MDNIGLSDGSGYDADDAAHRAALSEIIETLEAALAAMDELGLVNAALHVSLGLELAKGGLR